MTCLSSRQVFATWECPAIGGSNPQLKPPSWQGIVCQYLARVVLYKLWSISLFFKEFLIGHQCRDTLPVRRLLRSAGVKTNPCISILEEGLWVNGLPEAYWILNRQDICHVVPLKGSIESSGITRQHITLKQIVSSFIIVNFIYILFPSHNN